MNALPAIVKLSSVSALDGLTQAQVDALGALGIVRLSDLLGFRPILDARMLVALASGGLAFDDADLLDAGVAGSDPSKVAGLAPASLKRLDAAQAKILLDAFGVASVGGLAEFAPFAQAERRAFAAANEFSEPASAPEELLPTILGNVQSTVNFSAFVKERTVRLRGLELVYDEQSDVDPRLAALFPVRGFARFFDGLSRSPLRQPVPEVQLGMVAKMTQSWLNLGSHLGEVVHSLPLAPGESRNVAIIDWKRRQATARTEDTEVEERLSNALFHKRALDEVTRSTASEHQSGGTEIAAGTLATAGAGVLGASLVGGVAGTLPGAAIGAVAGAFVGPEGIPVGALAGAVIGFGAGAAIGGGAALVGAANAQLGTIQSDSSGNREIFGAVSQSISEMTVQKASSVRSLWSAVVVTDEQSENERLSTRNVTNYNHSHALTIQYYEVLQRYRSQVSLAAADPILLLPFRPLEFTLDLIADYWETLKHGIPDRDLRRGFEAALNGIEQAAESGSPKVERLEMTVVRIGPRLTAPFTANLSGIEGTKEGVTVRATFGFDPPVDADLLAGVQALGLARNEVAFVTVKATLANDLTHARRVVERRSEALAANAAGVLDYDVRLVRGDGRATDRKVDEIVRYFNSRRYAFTRLLLLGIEREQLMDMVEALMLRPTVGGGLFGPPSLFPSPFAAASRTLPDALMERARGAMYTELSGVLTEVKALRQSPAERDEAVLGIIERVGADLRRAAPDDPKDAARLAAAKKAVKAGVASQLAQTPGLEKLANADRIRIDARVQDLLDDALRDLLRKPFEGSVHLSEFIDPSPLAITGNALVFKMRRVTDPEVLRNGLVTGNATVRAMKEYPENVSDFMREALDDAAERRRHTRGADVFLPTSGVFAEAILGRSNASEKIDVTRFFNWQDSPIPHQAPIIGALTAGSRDGGEIETTPTVPGSVLNIVNPAAFPDPTGLANALAAVQNGNLFRDMSKADQLASTLANLSGLAQSMADQAGTLAGAAQAEALKGATEIGKAVADLAAQSASGPANAPTTPTGQGAAINELEKLKASPNPLPNLDEDVKTVVGAGTPRSAPKKTGDVLFTFSIEDVNEFPFAIDRLPTDSGNAQLLGSKVGERAFDLQGSQGAFAFSVKRADLDESPIRLSINLLDAAGDLVFAGSTSVANPIGADAHHFRAVMGFVTTSVADTENASLVKEVKKSFALKFSPNLAASLTPSVKASAKLVEAGVEGTVGGGASGEIGGGEDDMTTDTSGNARETKFEIKSPTGQLKIVPL